MAEPNDGQADQGELEAASEVPEEYRIKASVVLSPENWAHLMTICEDAAEPSPALCRLFRRR